MYINLKGHPMRVCFYTLGCKVNLNETGALEQMFRSAGFTIVPEGEEADVFVVNSCTVTNFGDQKSRKWLRRAKRENPGAVTVLTGSPAGEPVGRFCIGAGAETAAFSALAPWFLLTSSRLAIIIE